jgi:hypothetical protein
MSFVRRTLLSGVPVSILNNTVLAFCLDTKKRGRGRALPYRQLGESRIVSKQNASSVYDGKGTLIL